MKWTLKRITSLSGLLEWQPKISTPLIFDYDLVGLKIERVNQNKHLDVVLDTQLSFRQYIAYVVEKA